MIEKKETAERYLAHGVAHFVVDARQLGVDVPEHCRRKDLVLKFSHRFDPPDLSVTTWGISQTLRFNGTEFYRVRVPWSAIYLAASNPLGEGHTWEAPSEPPIIGKRIGGIGLVN